MRPFFHLLGVAAKVVEWLSRRGLNFVPLHLIAMILLGVLIVIGWREFGMAMANDATARPVGIAEVLAHRDLDRNYVAVQGTLVPVAVFEYTRTTNQKSVVEASYLPLISIADRKGLMVKRKGTAGFEKEPYETVVRGLLMPLDSEVRLELEKSGGKVEDLPFDLDWMLEEGRAPGSAPVWLITTVAAGAFLLAMLVAWQRRYVVFQVAPPEPPQPGQAEPVHVDVRASGRFDWVGQKPRRFVDVGVRVGRLSSGRIGLQAADQLGAWTIALEPRELGNLEPGFQYLGFERRPALRIHHEDARRRPTSTVVSCGSALEVRMLVKTLARLVAEPPAEPASHPS